MYPKSHTHARCNKPEKSNDFATKEAQPDILLGGGWSQLRLMGRAARCRGDDKCNGDHALALRYLQRLGHSHQPNAPRQWLLLQDWPLWYEVAD